MSKGYSVLTKTTRFAICDYCGNEIRHYGAGKLEGYAARHVQLCRWNPANKSCETCVHAHLLGLDLHCDHQDRLISRWDAPYPCPNHTAAKPDGAA